VSKHQKLACFISRFGDKKTDCRLLPSIRQSSLSFEQFILLPASNRLSPSVRSYREGTKNLSDIENLARVFLKIFEDIQKS
jgi:hypothetical protein